MKRIVITGPESTGKTALTKALANYFNGEMVPELAREYLNTHGLDYTVKDVESIAKLQFEAIQQARYTSNDWLFCDTDLLVIKIWMEYKYGDCPLWIDAALAKQAPTFSLLCDIDLPWEEDPMREHPNERKTLFHLYETYLISMNRPYAVVSGSGQDRVDAAIGILKKEFKG